MQLIGQKLIMVMIVIQKENDVSFEPQIEVLFISFLNKKKKTLNINESMTFIYNCLKLIDGFLVCLSFFFNVAITITNL